MSVATERRWRRRYGLTSEGAERVKRWVAAALLQAALREVAMTEEGTDYVGAGQDRG